ncbi:MAG: putative membrane-spanning protein [Bacteroidetes bacterium]|nr:MAG: putative membrane-spanning protein [Bacteroidota bacterium]
MASLRIKFRYYSSLCIQLIAFLFLLHGVSNAQKSSDGTNPVTDFNRLPEISWVLETGKPIFASPVVIDNLVYAGGLDSILHAVDLMTGKEMWQFRTGGEIRSAVCPAGNKLYLNGGDGSVYAIESLSGKVIWEYKTQGEKKYDFADYFHSSPVICGDLLCFGSGDGNVYALNSETGQKVWSFKTGNVVHSTPAYDHGKLFAGSFDGYFYALDLKTGELIWKFKTVGHRYFPLGEVQGSPCVFGNLVIFGARDYNVYCLDQLKGFGHWNKAFSKGWGLSNSICDSVLYTGSADERILIAANPFTGDESWRKNMEFLIFGNNAYTDGMLYVGTTIGKLHGISRKSGEKVWSFATGSYQDNRFRYFREDDSYRDDIYEIIKSNEQFLEVECELGGIFSTPVISGDFLLFTSTNGMLYCLKRA